MKVADLQIDFPEIEGYSSRQVWFAEKLVEAYVMSNHDRFHEIERLSNIEADERMRVDAGNYENNEYKEYTFNLTLSDAEKVCLFCCNAGGVISVLKPLIEKHPEYFAY